MVETRRLKKEQEEKEDKRSKAQAHLYTIIKVARDEDLREQIGKDIYYDPVDHDKIRSFRIQKQMPFNLFKDLVPSSPPDNNKDDILLFFKLYNPEKEELHGNLHFYHWGTWNTFRNQTLFPAAFRGEMFMVLGSSTLDWSLQIIHLRGYMLVRAATPLKSQSRYTTERSL